MNNAAAIVDALIDNLQSIRAAMTEEASRDAVAVLWHPAELRWTAEGRG